MGPKEKIRQYIEHKGITVYAFEQKAGIGKGVMGKGRDFGVSLLTSIRRNISDLNMNWLIYDEGEMILKEESTPMLTDDSRAVYELQTKLIETQENLISTQNKLSQEIKKNSDNKLVE